VTENIANPDTIKPMLEMAMKKAERHLESNDKMSTTAVIITGGWVEALYITSKVLAESTDTSDLYHNIWNHIDSFKYVVELLDQFKSNQNCMEAREHIGRLEVLLTPYRTKRLNRNDIYELSLGIAEIRNSVIS
jgi:hypothetical protein